MPSDYHCDGEINSESEKFVFIIPKKEEELKRRGVEEMSKGRILSGMRSTGRLHIGHLSVLENWVKLQDEYECFFMVADWHALTSNYADTRDMQQNIRDLVIDWMAAGLDPGKSTIFVQSHVKEHAELHLLFSMITPLSWLERVPTYKDQIAQLGKQGKDLNTYGFLGYPLLQAADILVYKANAVPVGEDQLPHLEFTREVARRFNFMYKAEIFPEPQPIIGQVALLPGIDGRKMSKSYNNFINISSESKDLAAKVNAMITDPARIKKTDPGHPEICTVHTYHTIYSAAELEDIRTKCRAGEIGCVACKKMLGAKLDELLNPIREKRAALEKNPDYVNKVLAEGAEKARSVASEVLKEVRKVMNM